MLLFMLPAAIAALVLSGGALGGLTKAGKLVNGGIWLKLLTSRNYRGGEGFLTPTITISMKDKKDPVGRFIVGLTSFFPELKKYIIKNGKPVKWVLTAPPIGGDKLGGEAQTLAAIIDPLKVAVDKANGNEKIFMQMVREYSLLRPLLDFLEQLESDTGWHHGINTET